MTQPVIIGDATLYHGDCLEILPTLPKVDAVITDPPYGAAQLFDKRQHDSAKWAAHRWDDLQRWDQATADRGLSAALALGGQAIVWGGHLYGLPARRGWLVWDKMQDKFSSGQCELAWTTLEQPIRRFNYSHGQLATEGKDHPTQKPLPLITWCVGFIRAETILDPFMGSGTTGVACANLGRKFIGIEIERKYFDIACERIDNAYRQQRMFA